MAYPGGDLAIQFVRFEDIVVGQRAEIAHELTQEDIQRFAALTGDFNPLHVDEEFARKTMFRKPIAHGMLSASFISTLIGMILPGGGALWTSQRLQFINPARAGDVLHAAVQVKQISPATRTIVLDVGITNQDGQTLVNGESIVKVLEIREDDATVKQDEKLTVLVTGGSRGIGAAIAERLAADGHSVVLNYVVNSGEANRVVAAIAERGGRGTAVRADIRQQGAVDHILEVAAQSSFGPVQALVHCAGSGSSLRVFGELDWAAFEQQIDVHVKGAFHCARAVLPQMVKAQSGSLVFLGSIAADGVPPERQADYVVAKSALAALARCLAVEYGPKGVRVNTIAPGLTMTDMIANLPEKAKLLARMQTPLRRLAEPSDIAAVASFLLSPGARHIAGETVRVCGGAVMV